MRKTILIVLSVVLIGSPLSAAPVSFATRPTAPSATATNNGPSGFGSWFSALRPFRQAAPSAQTGLPATTPLPTVQYNAGVQQTGPSKTDAALSLASQPDSPAAVLVAFAKAAEAQGNHNAAREHLQKAVGAAPSDPATLRAAGHFEDRRGKLEVAESLYRRAVDASTSNTAALNDLAICLARQQRMDESAVTFRQAIAKEPTKKLYRNNLAKVLVEQGDAASAFEQLAAVNTTAVAHYNLGYLLSTKGDDDAARQHYRFALAADPTLEAARQALAGTTKSKVASLSKPEALPAAPPETAPYITGAPITPSAPATPGFQPVAPGYRPTVASPYYLPPQGVQQR